jgi:uncharacterized Zn-binding protein involved in type VI secretion
MRRQGRLGDKAHVPFDSHGCPACTHAATGPAVSGSPDVRVNRKPALRIDDKGVHAPCCGANLWTAVEGSATVFINGRPAHRVGDATKHCGGRGKLIEGSDNVYVGGGLYQYQLTPSPCSALSNQYFYGTDTSPDSYACYDDFYIGKIGRGGSAIPGYLTNVPDIDVLSARWNAIFRLVRDWSGFEITMPEFRTQDAGFHSPLTEPARNFAYWTITGWVGENDPEENAPKWGRLQALLALIMTRGGPFSSDIGGRCLFADIEYDDPQPDPPTWILGRKDANRATVNAFLETVRVSTDFTPGIYTNTTYWNKILGNGYEPEITDFVLFTAEWPDGATFTINENGAVPPTGPELEQVFGSSPRGAHNYAGQQTRIWQFTSQNGVTDWDISPYDPLTNFTERRVNPRKGASLNADESPSLDAGEGISPVGNDPTLEP